MEKCFYVLSVWKNYEEPKNWVYDICPLDQYFKNARHYLLENGKPYYYSPLYMGTHEQCEMFRKEFRDYANELEDQLSEIPTL